MATVLDKLKSLVNQIDDKGCIAACGPECSAPNFPFLQVCMLEPPCAVVPTEPKYVKPLKLPSKPVGCGEVIDPEVDYKTRRSNFYNYHNVDFHKTGHEFDSNIPAKGKRWQRPNCIPANVGRPCCDENAGCPTGFKPCKVRLTPPCNGHPLATWRATVQPCPPKPKKPYSCFYEPKPCSRGCCVHYKPDRVCKYQKPCKAHCYDHPTGVPTSDGPC